MERRQFARIKVNLALKFQSLEQLENAISGQAADLSKGGIFIKTRKVKPVGTRVQIELPAPQGGTALIKGVVRSLRYQAGRPVGMGIEFEEMDELARELISRVIAKNQGK